MKSLLGAHLRKDTNFGNIEFGVDKDWLNWRLSQRKSCHKKEINADKFKRKKQRRNWGKTLRWLAVGLFVCHGVIIAKTLASRTRQWKDAHWVCVFAEDALIFSLSALILLHMWSSCRHIPVGHFRFLFLIMVMFVHWSAVVWETQTNLSLTGFMLTWKPCDSI